MLNGYPRLHRNAGVRHDDVQVNLEGGAQWVPCEAMSVSQTLVCLFTKEAVTSESCGRKKLCVCAVVVVDDVDDAVVVVELNLTSHVAKH